MDHLSLGSLDAIEDRLATLILPLGGSVYVPRGKQLPVELGVYQSWEREGLRITAVPVRHLGWRYAFDRHWMTTSYTGYVIEHRGLKVYFGGDMGYHPTLFRDVGEKFGPFDLVLLPIAPIEPREFTCRVHMDPKEALAVFDDLRGEVMVSVHFDTFVNSFDEVGAAGAALRAEMQRRQTPKERVVILEIGERAVLR